MRGLLDIEDIFPNADPLSTVLSGFAKFDVFVMLKNSVRTRKLLLPSIEKLRSMAISKLR